MTSPKIYLIPNTIGDESPAWIDEHMRAQILALRIFFVEEAKSARQFLRKLDSRFPLSECRFIELSEHTSMKELQEHFSETGLHDIGMISQAGCPCIADPGAELVRLGYAAGRTMIPLVGPSSIVLALMASGFNGQQFVFHGYLPKDRPARINKIKELQSAASKNKQTQIFIETPYRNQQMFDDLIQTGHPETQLCLAIGLLTSKQLIKAQSILAWKQTPFTLPKSPAVFLLA